ncbi:MAG: Ig-like domain-containing protein [bacterium]|nr:Ig-like domain-containing protein [bacterium]
MKANLKVLSLAALASLLGVGAVTASSVGIKNALNLGAEEDNLRSFTITAEEIGKALGESSAVARKAANFQAGGLEFHINNAYYADGLVNVSGGVFYNVTLAGSSVNAEKRVGTGFKKVQINGFDSKTGANSFWKGETDNTLENHPLGAVKEDQNIVFGGTDKVSRVEFAFGAGEGTYFSSVTYFYSCGYATPSITGIEADSSSIDVGGKANLTAKTAYASDAATYAWSVDDPTIASISGSGANAVLTGLKGGEVTVTCAFAEGEYKSSSTCKIKVNAAAAVKKDLVMINTSSVGGAGVFVTFNPKATGMTYDNVASYLNTANLEVTAKVIKGEQTVQSFHFQEQTDERAVLYVILNSAAESGEFALEIAMKDTSANIVYGANVYFLNGKMAAPVTLSGDGSVLLGETLTLTATKGYFLEGEASYAFSSDNEEVASVTSSGNVATVRGIKAGSANIKVTMTLGDKSYTATKKISVTSEAVEATVLHPTSGRIEGAQFWLYGVDNSALKVTGETMGQMQAKVSIEITYNGEGEAPAAIAPWLVKDKVKANSMEYKEFNPSTLTLYAPLTAGLDSSWDITWNIHIELQNAEGLPFELDCRFVKTTFVDGAAK